MTEPADLVAVQRAHADHGRDAAMAEVRRRWPNISETVLPATLERILAAPVAQPPTIVGHKGPRRDPPGLVRKNRSRS